ncbi:hypothetical protein FQN60_018726 [Etheostoma spectabile]|uniref:Kelch-like protein 20 n=1 Tax=Etheostoma spectabile TaxID=54343 RepID=A0A5J5CBF1_9PERO|nr:hypothetical protein FQN60_018726 [Etheostoma spectabile]
MDAKPMRRVTSARQDATGMDITSRCTLGDPNKLPEGVPQPARMPYVSDKHPRQTLEVINLLRKHRELCDVVLVVGAKKIYAHRVILSACSPYFRAMFTGELAESRQTEVVIRDIDERAMELLIDFAYTSQVTVEEEMSRRCSLRPAFSSWLRSRRPAASSSRGSWIPPTVWASGPLQTRTPAASCSALQTSSPNTTSRR